MKSSSFGLLILSAALTLPVFGGEGEGTAVIEPKVTIAKYDAMPKDPLASALFSATVCGTGQIYNKEYLRGIITGSAFWGSFFTVQLLMFRWQQINTDTVYFEELDKAGVPTNNSRAVYVLRNPEDQVGLPTGEKAVLISALAIGVSSYVFGIIDSYNGAHRYNKKLFAASPLKPEFYCSLGRTRNEAGLKILF